MKFLKAFCMLMAIAVGLLFSPHPATAQGKFVKITKIDCTTVSGSSVTLGDTLAGSINLQSFKKGTYVYKHAKYTNGFGIIFEPVTRYVLWQGPLTNIRVPGTAANATDSTKAVFLLKYFAN